MSTNFAASLPTVIYYDEDVDVLLCGLGLFHGVRVALFCSVVSQMRFEPKCICTNSDAFAFWPKPKCVWVPIFFITCCSLEHLFAAFFAPEFALWSCHICSKVHHSSIRLYIKTTTNIHHRLPVISPILRVEVLP
jgi:hypothetical protein